MDLRGYHEPINTDEVDSVSVENHTGATGKRPCIPISDRSAIKQGYGAYVGKEPKTRTQ